MLLSRDVYSYKISEIISTVTATAFRVSGIDDSDTYTDYTDRLACAHAEEERMD